MASPDDSTIEAYYHASLEACAHASQLEGEALVTDALTEYRRSMALIDTMRHLARDTLRDTDEAYFAGIDDVEGICRVRIAKLVGDLPPSLAFPLDRGPQRRKSSDSVNTLGRGGGLSRMGSVAPREEVVPPERSRRTRVVERTKPSRSPSPEKKEKQSMPLSLRTHGPQLNRATSSDSANGPGSTGSLAASQAAIEASRAATVAWQGKKLPSANGEPKKIRNASPTSCRAGSIDINSAKRTSVVSDSGSLLDVPLIDFSAPATGISASSVHEFQTWMPLSPTPTPPPQSQLSQSSHVESEQPIPRRKQQHPPNKSLGRSNAHVRPSKPSRPPPPPARPRFSSAPDLTETVQGITEIPPISVSISEDISLEELSREEKVLKEMKGVDETLAKTILNEIVVKGDEVQWDDIAGLEDAKTSLKETVIYPFLRPDLFSGLREPARGMLLFGPPGTGKTMLARAVATQAKSTFFSVSASTLVSKYLGESEKLVRALFTLAKALSPSIIFVDEIDSLLTSRSASENENEASRRLKTEFLIQWSSLASAAAARSTTESPRVLVLAATNLPWAIDDAARRRFVLRQYIPLPEADTRRVQFRTLLSRQHHTLTDEQLDQLVSMTDGFSGSDITALTKDAAMGPLRSLGEALLTTKREEIRPIGFDDFVTSLRKIRPSVSKESLKAFEKWNDEFGSKG